MTAPEPFTQGALAVVQQLLGPVAEAGEVLRDKVRFYRWKSSLKTIERAKEIAKENGIPIKEVPLKLLIPFIEKSSLEEEDSPLIERWANLLASGVADSSNASTIYTEILARLSPADVAALDMIAPPSLIKEISTMATTPVDRAAIVKLSGKQRATYEFVRDSLADITKNQNAVNAHDGLSEFATALILKGGEPYVEHFSIRFSTGTNTIYRYTAHFEALSALDVLVSCGLISRHDSSCGLVLAEASLTFLLPTLLGLKFVAACRGDNFAQEKNVE